MKTAWLLALLTSMPALAGCTVPFGLGWPDYHVERTALETGEAWNLDGRFLVRVLETQAVAVEIEARSEEGRVVGASGMSNATLPAVALTLPDGTWTVTYTLDGRKWETMGPARVDATPPTITGLETIGTALGGEYLLGATAHIDRDAFVRVIRQLDGAQVASSLPARLRGLGDGVHGFDVVASDAAGNQAAATVQVRSGAATQLPAGRYTLGITARYTSQARLWDLTALSDYASPTAARVAVGGQWLGNGTGLAPLDPAVQGVVQQVVEPSMSTGQVAFALFQWMVDNTDYDTARLGSQDLLLPAQTIQVEGGVCRDLAALYASLLRGAGVPARLVTGYLGGRVGGFHAWVEFYGGEGHGPSPWVPVDVSLVDGSYTASAALQAFGARLPNMLGLHVVTPTQEQGDWTHAAATSTRYPPDQPAPDVKIAQNLTAEFREEGVLCIDSVRLARAMASKVEACGTEYPLYVPKFLSRAAFILDYGAVVETSSRGAVVTVTLSYPDPDTVAPDTVEPLTYGATFTTDTTADTKSATLNL